MDYTSVLIILTFGGVATGKQNAQLQANVMGIINVYGDTSNAVAMDADIGIINEDVAVLDGKQVIKLMKSVIINTCIGKFILSRLLKVSPKYVDKPLVTKPFANAKPPPNKNIISYGNFELAVFQSNNVVVDVDVVVFEVLLLSPSLRCCFAGIINSRTVIHIPMVASDI